MQIITHQALLLQLIQFISRAIFYLHVTRYIYGCRRNTAEERWTGHPPHPFSVPSHSSQDGFVQCVLLTSSYINTARQVSRLPPLFFFFIVFFAIFAHFRIFLSGSMKKPCRDFGWDYTEFIA